MRQIESKCDSHLKIVSKVFKVIFLVLASVMLFWRNVTAFFDLFYYGASSYSLVILITGIVFAVILYFIGLFIEMVFLSYSIVTKNHFQELKIKGFYEGEDSRDVTIINELNILKIAFEKRLLIEEEYKEKKNKVLERNY